MDEALVTPGTDGAARDPDSIIAGRRAAALAAHDIHADRAAADRHLIADGISPGTVAPDQELCSGCPAEADFAALRCPGAVVCDKAAIGTAGYGAAIDEQLVGRSAAAIGVTGIDVFAHFAAVYLYLVAGSEAGQGISAGQGLPDGTAAHDETVPAGVGSAAPACGQSGHGTGTAGEFHPVVRGLAGPGPDVAAVGFCSQLSAGDGQGIVPRVAFMAETGTDEMVSARAADAAAADGEPVARAVAFYRIPGRHLGVGALDVAVADLQRIVTRVTGLTEACVDAATGPDTADTAIFHAHPVAGCLPVFRKAAVDIGSPGSLAPHLDLVVRHIALAVSMATVKRLGVQIPCLVGDDDMPLVRRVRTGSAIRGARVMAALRISGAADLAAAVGRRNGGSQQDSPQQQPCQCVSQPAFAQDQTVAAQQHAQCTLGLFHVSSFFEPPHCSLSSWYYRK